MANYQYWATTESGDTVSGRLTATSPDDAAHLLTVRGWVVQRLEELAAIDSAADQPLSLTDDDFMSAESPSPRDGREGLPLIADLRALAEETSRPSTRRALHAVIDSVSRGLTWEQALEELEAALPRRFTPLINAGVQTGRLPFLMHHALEHMRQAGEMRRRLWMSLSYPVVLIISAALILTGIFLGLVPSFKKIFRDFGTELPALTNFIVSVSDLFVGALSFFTQFGWWGLVIAGVLLAGLALIVMLLSTATSRIEEIQLFRQRMIRWIPVIGPVMHAASLSGWFRLVTMLIEARVPLPEAMRIAAAVNGDAALSAGVRRMIASLERGATPLEAAERAEALPREVLPIFRWAKNRELLQEGLQGAADMYAARSRMQSGLITVLLEPMLIFTVGLTVGLVVIGMFMPLITLLNDLS